MGLLRLFLLLAVVLLVARIVWRFIKPPSPPDSRAEAGRGFPADAKADSLLRCSRCGTLIPQELVLLHEDLPYCGPKCRDNTDSGSG